MRVTATLAVLLLLPTVSLADDGVPASGVVTPKRLGSALQDLDARARTTEQQLRALEHRARELDAFAIARGRSFVRLARAGLLPIGGGFSALVDHAARVEKLRRALERDLTEIEAVARERRRASTRLSELDGQRDLLETERRALERSHAAIAAAEERDQAFRQAFQSAGAPHTAVYAGGPSGNTLASGGALAALKGKLAFPVAGRLEIRTAARPGFGPGLEMVAAPGSPVRSVHPGRVAFADDHPGLGGTVLLDHGDGYFTLYAGVGAPEVRVGGAVDAGQVVGRVGAAGVIYVEIRQGDATLEPAPWFGL
jgi:murein hydrolase activator